MKRFLARLRSFFNSKRAEAEMVREMESHLSLLEDELLRRGVSSAEAMLAARRAYGPLEPLKELHREERSFFLLEQICQDARIGLRGFRRNPAFSLTALLIIAIGIGANTALFSMLDRLLLRGLPYADADRLLSVGITLPIMDGEFLMANDYFNLREHAAPLFSAVTSWTGVADCDLTEQSPEHLMCAQVESSFLPTFGVRPILGANFTREDDSPMTPKVALISFGLWQSRFGASRYVIGRTMEIDGVKTRIVGVLPPDFEVPSSFANPVHVDFLLPQALHIDHYLPGQSGRPLRVFARLAKGVSQAQAMRMLHPYLLPDLAWMPPARRAEVHLVVRSLREFEIEDVKLAAYVLWASAAVILLIVCANVTNLLLARALGRRRELATRAALGAGRARLARQAIVETTTLSVLGAVPGWWLASSLLALFRSFAPAGIPRLAQASLDGRTFLFTAAITLACGVVFGLLESLPSYGYRSERTPRSAFRGILTAAQVAFSLVLVSVAALLVQSFWNLQHAHTGFGVDHITTADITVGAARHPNARTRQEFFDALSERLRRIPTVEAVALSDTVPPTGFVHSRPLAGVRVAGDSKQAMTGGIAVWRRVSPDYFAALRIPLLQGRTFQEKERGSKQSVVMLSESLARRLFHGQNGVGREIYLSLDPANPQPATVIGVCADVANNGLTQAPDPEYYVLRKTALDSQGEPDAEMVVRSLHLYDGSAFVIVRSSARPDAVAQWIRGAAAALDGTVPVTIGSMQERLHAISDRPQFTAILLSLFAVLGLLLAAGGLYGLTSFLVVQQTPELGLRLAIGASRGQVAAMILRHSVCWTVVGAAIGVAGAAGSARFLRPLLFQVAPESWGLLGAASWLMILVAIVAVLAPSLKAARLDPAVVLRHE